MSREVVVFSMQDNSKESIVTDAETWGQLKNESSRITKMSTGMKVTIKENRTAIESDESILPMSDITLFLFPAKVKAGDDMSDKIIDEYSEKLSVELVNALEKDFKSYEKMIKESIGE